MDGNLVFKCWKLKPIWNKVTFEISTQNLKWIIALIFSIVFVYFLKWKKSVIKDIIIFILECNKINESFCK